MPTQFKELLLEVISKLKDHPDAQDGVGFVTIFDEEPDWKVILSFVPIKDEVNMIDTLTATKH